MSASTIYRPMRVALITGALALAAGMAQTAAAQPGGGPGWHGGPAMMGGPGMGGFGMGRGMFVERALDAVGASAEQKAQIRQILQAARTELRAQRETGRALHEQARNLFTQPNIDARAAESLRQQMLARHDQASKRMMQAMLDAANVLTPEQRAKLAERVAQRRAMMERHRAERRALDGAPSK